MGRDYSQSRKTRRKVGHTGKPEVYGFSIQQAWFLFQRLFDLKLPLSLRVNPMDVCAQIGDTLKRIGSLLPTVISKFPDEEWLLRIIAEQSKGRKELQMIFHRPKATSQSGSKPADPCIYSNGEDPTSIPTPDLSKYGIGDEPKPDSNNFSNKNDSTQVTGNSSAGNEDEPTVLPKKNFTKSAALITPSILGVRI